MPGESNSSKKTSGRRPLPALVMPIGGINSLNNAFAGSVSDGPPGSAQVDVQSLEPLRLKDHETLKQLQALEEASTSSLARLDTAVSAKAEASQVEHSATRQELELVAEELRRRCTASEAATIQRLRELSYAIAASQRGADASADPDLQEGETPAGLHH